MFMNRHRLILNERKLTKRQVFGALIVKLLSVSMSLRFKTVSDPAASLNAKDDSAKTQTIDLGNGSEVVYLPRLLNSNDSWKFFDYLNKEIPWTRPTVRVFGRSHIQVRFDESLSFRM